MTLMEAISERHSVRSYSDKEIPEDIINELRSEIEDCNKDGNLHIQLVTNEQKAFESMLAKYGKFSGVKNYIALIGKDSVGIEEKIGYYGEKIVIKAQMLGLNTCWVAMSFSKGTVKKVCNLEKDERLVCVVSLGYGNTHGNKHKSKPIEELYKSDKADIPDWFIDGVKSASLAPTAINQQKFMFFLSNSDEVRVRTTGGFYSLVDLGIVKYHFEAASGVCIR